MVAVPVAIPVSMPDVKPIVATPVLLLPQEPPPVLLLSVEVVDWHIVVVPAIAEGVGLIVTIAVTWQPVASL